jgi:hypothetical protein
MIGAVKTELLLRLRDDPAARTWRRTVDRPYPNVPRAGDWIFLDDGGTVAQQVTRVTWRNDGSIGLGFGSIVAEDDFDDRLLEFGFAAS